MKILMVNKFLSPVGGAETYMITLGKALEKRGHEVQFFGMDSADRQVGNKAGIYTDNIDFRNASALKKIEYSLKSIYSKEARRKIGAVLDDFKPDIVHLNNINFQLTPAIIYEIKKRGIPAVQTLHDVQLACPCHRFYIEHEKKICMLCQNGNYLNCIKHKCVHNSFAKSIPAAIESYYYHSRGTYSLIDKFICPSRFMANTAHKAGINENKTIVLHNFSDKKASGSKRSSTGEPYALYFGRLSVEKGIGTLVQAAKELPGIKFVFAGTGPLEDLCKNIPNIEYAGFKSGKELSDLIENAEFSICPSECHENCPMTVAESVSLGTPVIGSDLGGIPELIKSGKTGIVFEAGNKEALKAAIQTLYSDKELSSEMAQNCRSESFNDIEKYTERLSEIYSDLISENG